jgi:hypothetical protein
MLNVSTMPQPPDRMCAAADRVAPPYFLGLVTVKHLPKIGCQQHRKPDGCRDRHCRRTVMKIRQPHHMNQGSRSERVALSANATRPDDPTDQVVTKLSPWSVADTVARLSDLVTAKG